MATIKREKKFRCFNDCRMEGCPSHTMSVSIQTTSEVLIVEIDGEKYLSTEPNQWNTLKEILREIDYNQFDLNPPLLTLLKNER